MIGSDKQGHHDVWQNFRTEAPDDKPHISSWSRLYQAKVPSVLHSENSFFNLLKQ
jgi:hypothetical protein